MSQSLHPMLNIAIKAARAAGAIINRGALDIDLLKVTSKGPNDFVSEVDQAAEAAIIETILGAYPGHGILAEESGRTHGARHSDYVWIIDPLDGTTNFLHGLPIYAVSIALAHKGVVQQAVVYDPARNDLFYASRGRGAFLNDRRLRVSKRIRLADSLIGTGFPFRRGDNLHRYVEIFEQVMQQCAGLRRPGAAALDLCYVAAGWYDGFFEIGLNPWDVAAGSLMITEAGGLIGNFTGEADFLYQREVVAATPKVYGQLVQLLAPHSRVIKDDDAPAAPSVAGVTPEQALAAAVQADAAPGDAAPAQDAPTAEPVRERKPIRIRKADLPPAEPAPTPARGPARDAARAPARAPGRAPARGAEGRPQDRPRTGKPDRPRMGKPDGRKRQG